MQEQARFPKSHSTLSGSFSVMNARAWILKSSPGFYLPNNSDDQSQLL